jgi:trigger factor
MSDENLNFNEVDETENETPVEGNVTESGNFNEIDTYETDASDGNFNETDGNDEDLTQVSTYNNTGNPATGSASSYSPTSKPEKNGSSKVLVGVVAALGIVIVGLIIFLVVSLINKKNANTDTSAEPTKIITDITVDGTGDITGTADTSRNTSDGSSDNSSVIETPTFNVTCELGQYKGITVDYESQEVTEEDVQGALTYFAESMQQKTDVTDRPLKEGDTAIIDFVGTMDGEVFDGGSATGFELVLGSGSFINGFEDGLIGKNIGDSVSLDLTFPDPYYNNPDFAGKPVNFLVNINSAYEYVIPELTDELVSANSDYASVEEYSNAARAELEKQAKEYSDSKASNDIIKAVIDNATFGGQVDEEIAYEIQDCLDYYDTICQQQFGVSGAVYFGYLWGITEQEYNAMVEEESTMSVKYNAVLDEIAKVENLTVSDEEFENMFQSIFIDQYGFASKEEVFSQFGEEQANETIKGYVLHDKAEAIIMDSAVINNKPEE